MHKPDTISKRDFLTHHWGSCFWIWLPQLLATAIAAFLFHRLSDCARCFGFITNPQFLNFKKNSAVDGSLMFVTAELYVCMIAAAIVIFISNCRFL